MPAISITPIQHSDLAEIGAFLHEHLNRRITAAAWIDSVTHPWSESRPNYGMQLRDDGKLAGVFCAVYSDQTVDGKVEKFCNPHSWCVLESHRNQGINLLTALVRQRGYHFTMLTPNPKVAEIFRHFKFIDINREIVVFPNVGVPRGFFGNAVTTSDKSRIAALLTGETARDFALHRDIPWLRFVAFGTRADTCLVSYKIERWKKMPCARILYISDAASFDRNAALVRQHLLYQQGLLVTKVERRFLARRPLVSYKFARSQAKLFLSPTLRDSQLKDIYTELASLDV